MIRQTTVYANSKFNQIRFAELICTHVRDVNTIAKIFDIFLQNFECQQGVKFYQDIITEFFTDLDKLNFVKFEYGGSVLGTSHFS